MRLRCFQKTSTEPQGLLLSAVFWGRVSFCGVCSRSLPVFVAADFSAFMAPNSFRGSNILFCVLCLLPRVSHCTSSGRKNDGQMKAVRGANSATFFKVLVTGSGIMLGVDLLDLVKRYKNYFCVYLLHNDGSLLTAYVTRTRFWVKEMPV